MTAPRHVPPIIAELFSRLDQLIGLVADDATLRGGLLRERARLHRHIEERELLPVAHRLADDPRRWPPRAPQPDRARSVRRLGGPCRRLRLCCYLALAAGFVDARRFDSLMLLGSRAMRPRRVA